MAASVFLSECSSSLASHCRDSISYDCRYFVRGSDEFKRKKSATFELSYQARFGTVDAFLFGRRDNMKLKTKLVTSVLAGAMLAIPFVTAPAFAEPANSVNSNYVQRVDWWHHDYDDGYRYRNRGYYGNRYYGNRYYGNRYYGNPYAYGYGYRGYGACNNARRLQEQAWRDRRTGHPAAAWDVAQQARWARARCY